MPSKWQWYYVSLDSWNFNEHISTDDPLLETQVHLATTSRKFYPQKWSHSWSPKDNVHLATWAKWSSKQKQQVLWRGLKKGNWKCQVEGHGKHAARYFPCICCICPGSSSALAWASMAPSKPGTAALCFDDVKHLTQKILTAWILLAQDSMPVGQMELVGPPGTVWACGFGEAAQREFLDLFGASCQSYKVRWFQHVATTWWSWDLSQRKWWGDEIWKADLTAPRTRVVNLFGSIFNATQLGVTCRAICGSTWVSDISASLRWITHCSYGHNLSSYTFFVMSSILQFVSSCTFSSFTKSNFDIYSKLSKTHRSIYLYICICMYIYICFQKVRTFLKKGCL